ncbi:MAG: MATE family efflux transporter [Bacteroidota bacterium]|nr:MATE family efflux transporter [Bacteroidota bacterium]
MRKEATRTWKLSGPIILGELTQIALGIIDNIMVGAISYRHLAAAALVISVINIPFVLGIGMTMSVSQTVSMAHGRKDGFRVSHYLYNGFIVCTLLAVIIAVVLAMSKGILFHLGQDPEVARLAAPFLELMAWSTIPMLMFIALKQFTDGLERTRTAMLLSFFALPINIFLNWLLIFGNWGFPRLELIGAGIGTLITRILILIVFIIVLNKHRIFRRYLALGRNQWKLKIATIKELLYIGIPSSLQVSLESGAFAVSAILIGTLGAVQLAAHQIAISCATIAFMVSWGLAQGGSIRVSNAWGRNNWKEISAIGKSTLGSAVIYGICGALVFILFRNELPKAFGKNKEVLSLAALLMVYAAIFQISDATQAVGAGISRGIKDVKIPTLFIAIAYWVVGIPLGCLMAFHFKMGAPGMWIGFVGGLTFSSISLNRRFFRKLKAQGH